MKAVQFAHPYLLAHPVEKLGGSTCALARADALGDTTLDKITGTSLDTGVEMDAMRRNNG